MSTQPLPFGLNNKPDTTLLLAQVEQHSMWEELNTRQNTAVRFEHKFLISD